MMGSEGGANPFMAKEERRTIIEFVYVYNKSIMRNNNSTVNLTSQFNVL